MLPKISTCARSSWTEAQVNCDGRVAGPASQFAQRPCRIAHLAGDGICDTFVTCSVSDSREAESYGRARGRGYGVNDASVAEHPKFSDLPALGAPPIIVQATQSQPSEAAPPNTL